MAQKPVKGSVSLFATVDPDLMSNEMQVVVSHTDFEEEDKGLEKYKKEREAQLGILGTSSSDNDPRMGAKTQAEVFAQGLNYAGCDHDGIPPDNHLAVGRNGYVVAVANSTVCMYDSTGKRVRNMKLSAFANNDASLNFVFDPRVIYDPVDNRFIMVFLNGGNPTTSTVVVCFSTTSNPTQSWKIYKLQGDFLKDDSWFDYPSIGVSKNELFITGNLFYGNNNSFNRAIILQMPKDQGYTGAATLKYQYWVDLVDDYGVGLFSPVPASHGQEGEVGPEMYFISTPSRGADYIQVTRISNEMTDPNVRYTSEEIFIEPYDVPSNGLMKNSGSKYVRTNDCRTQAAFMMNNTIFFTFHGTNTQSIYSRVFFGKYSLKDKKAKTTNIGINLFHYVFPALCSFGNDTTDEAVMIGFLSTSRNTFPDCRYVLCSKEMGWTTSFLIAQGTTYFNNLGGTTTERWGDYTGVTRHPGKINPTAWIHATYPSTSGRYANRIVEVRGVGLKSEMPENKDAMPLSVYPNPVEDDFHVKFRCPASGNYIIRLFDDQGRLVKELSTFHGEEGEHLLTFTKGTLSSGIYVVQVSGQNQTVAREKVVIP